MSQAVLNLVAKKALKNAANSNINSKVCACILQMNLARFYQPIL